MLTGRQHDAASHQCRGVTAMRDVFGRRRNLEVVEIGPDEDVTGILGRRFEFEVDLNACVQTDSDDGDFI